MSSHVLWKFEVLITYIRLKYIGLKFQCQTTQMITMKTALNIVVTQFCYRPITFCQAILHIHNKMFIMKCVTSVSACEIVIRKVAKEFKLPYGTIPRGAQMTPGMQLTDD